MDQKTFIFGVSDDHGEVVESPWYVALIAPTNAMGGGGSIPIEGGVNQRMLTPT